MLLIIRKLRRNDEGAALAAVLGLILVGVLLSVLIMSSVISAVSNTTATRASVQAQAAAQAGLAVAFAGLQTSGSCAAHGAIYENTASPKFRATVWYGAAIGCPTGSGTVRIVSTGYAASKGVAGNKFGDVAYLEATYSIAASNPSGAAIYLYNGGQVNGFTIAVADPSTSGNIQMPSGDFRCSTASTINGDIVVANGNVEMSNSCKVTGSIRASGYIKLNNTVRVNGDVISSGSYVDMQSSASVGGSVYANGAFTLYGTVEGSVEATGSVKLNDGALVKGNIAAGGDAEIRGVVNGNVTAVGAGSMPSSNGRVKGNLTVGGGWSGNLEGFVEKDLSIRGNSTVTYPPNTRRITGNWSLGGIISTWGYAWDAPGGTAAGQAAYYIKANGWVGGTISYSATGLPLPVAPTPKAAPTVPGWVDWKYVPATWAAAGFANTITFASNECSINNYDGTNSSSALYSKWQQVLNATNATVVDMSACSSFDFSNSANIVFSFKTDVAFIGKGFTFGGVKLNSGDGNAHKVYFLVPDGDVNTAGAQCSNGSGSIGMNSATIVSAPIQAMLYTPCTIQISNDSKWRGQFYSSNIAVSSNDGVTYVPTGIPGTNLDGVTGGAVTGSLGNAVSIRNVSSNGE